MDGGSWEIDDYALESGHRPIQTFLDGLAGNDRVDAFALIKLLRKWGNMLREPHSKSLGNGLFELRRNQIRIFYVFQAGRRIVLLDGMTKKRGDIPAQMMRRLRKFQGELSAMTAKAARGP